MKKFFDDSIDEKTLKISKQEVSLFEKFNQLKKKLEFSQVSDKFSSQWYDKNNCVKVREK